MATVDVPNTGYFEYAPKLVRDYLLTRLPDDIPVVTEVPNPRPARLVLVRSASMRGNSNLALSQRRCIIRTWDHTELLACRLAEKVRGFLVDAVHLHGNGIRFVEVAGEPAYYPDPDDPSGSPRAQLTIDLTLRATFAL